MNIYIYIYTHTYIYIYTHTSLSLSLSIIHIYIYIYIYMYVYRSDSLAGIDSLSSIKIESALRRELRVHISGQPLV